MELIPGLAAAAGGVALALSVEAILPGLSPLTAAVLLGAVAGNSGRLPTATRPGLTFAAKRMLRFGIVLLGFRLAIADVLRLGVPGLVLVVTVVATTFTVTRWAGRRLGVGPELSLLIATGWSICGASAIAAMREVTDAEEEEVAYAVALVTLCGSLAVLLLPLLRVPLGLAPEAFGAWSGASVHDVGQVVATAATAGPVSLQAAVVVKLTRVVLLAPLVVGASLAQRRGTPPGGQSTTSHGGHGEAHRPPVLPLFVACFLAAVAVRSLGVLPASWLSMLKTAEVIILAAALVGLGSEVRLAKLRRVGGRPLLLGLLSWGLVAAVAYAGVRLLTTTSGR